MKKCLLICCCFMLLVAASCSGHKDNDGKNAGAYTPPPAGTIVAADSMAVKEDPLNHFMFSITIKACSNTQHYGVYDVVAAWGPNNAASQFTMPHGGEKLKPILKKGATPYTYIIGFHYGKDTTFYDYYQVSGNKGAIEAKYLKAYSFK